MGLGGGAEGKRRAPVVDEHPATRGVRDDVEVNAVECHDVLLHGEQFEGACAGGGAQARAPFGVAQQRHARLRERPRFARGYDQARAADDLRHGAHVGGDRGTGAEHGFDQADGEALDDAGEDDDRSGGVHRREVGGVRSTGLLEGDRAVVGGVGALGAVVREEPGGQGPAVVEVGQALGARGGADDAQAGRRHAGADLGEGVEQGDQVLGGVDAPHPDQRVRLAPFAGTGRLAPLAGTSRLASVVGTGRLAPLTGTGRLGEAGRLHAGVDRAQPGPVGAEAFLPAADVGVAGGDAGGPPVHLGGEQAVEGGEQRAYGGGRVGGGEVVRPDRDAVLGDHEGHPGEVPGEQCGQGCGAARRGVAQVDRTEPGVLVPVQGEGAQGAFDVPCHGEEFGHARSVRRARRSGRAAGALPDAQRALRAQRAPQSALLAGEVGEDVQRVAETVRLTVARTAVRTVTRTTVRAITHATARAIAHASVLAVARPDTRAAARPGTRAAVRTAAFADRAGEVGVRLGEAAQGTAAAQIAAVGGVVVRDGPQRGGAHPGDLGRQRDPALVLLPPAAAERVDVELVPREPAHEPVAPEPGVTAHVRITTLRQQSDAHECIPDLPCGEPPLSGGSQREERMRTCRWRDGRLSIAPPKGVNRRNFPGRAALAALGDHDVRFCHTTADSSAAASGSLSLRTARRRAATAGSSAGTAASSSLVYGSAGASYT